MKESFLVKALPIGLAVAGAAAFLLWQIGGSGRLMVVRDGTDPSEGGLGTATNSLKWEGKLIPGPGASPANFSGLWPWFRGPNLNAIRS